MRHYVIVFGIFGTNIGNKWSCSALELKLPMWFAMRRKLPLNQFYLLRFLRHSRQRYIPRCQYGPSSYTDGTHSWISPDSRHRCAIDVCQIFKHDIVCYCLDIYENCFLVSTQTHLQNRLLLRSCQNKQLANANILLYLSTVAWQKICYPYPIPDLTGWNSDRVELSGGSNSATCFRKIRRSQGCGDMELFSMIRSAAQVPSWFWRPKLGLHEWVLFPKVTRFFLVHRVHR